MILHLRSPRVNKRCHLLFLGVLCAFSVNKIGFKVYRFKYSSAAF
jgi:hypothetical protein